LECIREVIPFAFAYDHMNYSRYLSVMLSDMLSLENDFPEIHRQFSQGNFAAQLTEGVFSRTETDKVIEMTLNKDTKTPGGTTGFSTNIGAVQRWEINAAYRASLRSVFHKHLNFNSQVHKHKDLSPSRIAKDEECIASILSILQESFVDPFGEQPLLSISRGIALDEAAAREMISAKELGSKAMACFKQRFLDENRSSIFDPIKKKNLCTFDNVDKKKVIKPKTKLISLQSTKELFAKVAIIAQKRSVDLKKVLSYPLINLPLALADSDGSLKKTSKSLLLHKIEGDTPPVDMLQLNHAFIVDGMAHVRQLKTSGLTFCELSIKLLNQVIKCSRFASRIDVVFDVYLENSIKDVERERRSSGEMVLKKIVPTSQIKQWSQLLSSGDFKNKLISYFVDHWKTKRELLRNKELYVNNASETWRFTTSSIELARNLHSNQEEADTRLILHAKHASLTHHDIIISSPDTDVFVIALSQLGIIDANIFMMTGTGDKKRLIDLKAVAGDVSQRLNQTNCSEETYFEAVLGFHCFTGCDSTSSFCGRGKNKPLKMMGKCEEYINAFAALGSSNEVSESVAEVLGSFVCHMYGKKDALQLGISLNDLRYQIYCNKAGKVKCQALPPCLNVLEQHIKRVNYQTQIWRKCLEASVDPGNPAEHGWCIDENGLSIKWMTCNPVKPK